MYSVRLAHSENVVIVNAVGYSDAVRIVANTMGIYVYQWGDVAEVPCAINCRYVYMDNREYVVTKIS